MDGKKLFQKYYARLVREGLLKALVCGLIVGFAVCFVVAFVFWLLPVDGLWISIGSGVGAIAIATPLFYNFRFKPSTHKIAKRIDLMGLKERLITMEELENDDSYIARRQREDAMKKLNEVDKNRIKMHVSRATVIAASILFVFGAGMTTVTGLSDAGILKSGNKVIDDLLPDPPPNYIAVNYFAEEGGVVEGEEVEQLVLEGEMTLPVVAVADEGWMFVAWSDGLEEPARQDGPIKEPMDYFAIFQQVEEQEGGGGGGDGEPSDEPSDQPSEGESSSNPEEPNESNGAGGSYEEKNMIMNGGEYYRHHYEEYYQRAMEILASDGELTAEERAFIEAYFGIIE